MIKELIDKNIQKGMVFNNPGGGTSIIVNVTDTYITYKRKNSNIRLDTTDIIDVYTKYKGKEVCTKQLKSFKPSVFCSDNNGHSCNCTFLFLILEKIGLLESGIEGKGVRGNSFGVRIK